MLVLKFLCVQNSCFIIQIAYKVVACFNFHFFLVKMVDRYEDYEVF